MQGGDSPLLLWCRYPRCLPLKTPFLYNSSRKSFIKEPNFVCLGVGVEVFGGTRGRADCPLSEKEPRAVHSANDMV